jgi:hypothetical protein
VKVALSVDVVVALTATGEECGSVLGKLGMDEEVQAMADVMADVIDGHGRRCCRDRVGQFLVAEFAVEIEVVVVELAGMCSVDCCVV